MISARKALTTTALLAGILAGPAEAAQCGNDASGFPAWLQAFKGEARAAGLSRSLSALDGLSYDAGVIRLDRSQKPFKMSYEAFVKQRLSSGRVSNGKKKMAQYAALLRQLEQRYGVPGSVIIAIWGMETDYGAVRGSKHAIRSLATLAYDCRRSGFFTNELLAALTIVERGRMTPQEMVGGWAGEIGQTQFLASKYLQFAVDGNGDGRADVVGTPADVLASTANYLSAHGWQRGAGYQPGEPNFAVIAEWNSSSNYQRTIARFAEILEGG
ncbi:lytic murein transglycosylase [Propylenella binzhouense]|uniref:Lytic murein transglycosylase n=1 Tax=Propylenella binzhouense TaxID=2555902 RepID=A0A964T3S9_9HYPH|nr:lytic murein transglycosylase [Propylenella binzhouense]MYZ47402.1 lytic murein transglycosylase [Propylenella binzhouense]